MDSSFLLYLQNINDIPLLSHQEERETALKAQEGNEEARSKLVTANLRFVVKIAKRYANKGVPLNDLVSEGNIGLIRATKTFDPKRGYHFISYAVHWIKQSIVKSLAEKSKPIRIPLSWNNKLVKIRRYVNDYGTVTLSHNKLEHISEKLEIKESELIRLLQLSQNQISLDQSISTSTNKDSIEVKNTIANVNSIAPDEALSQKYFKERLHQALHELKPTERDILKRRFALGRFAQSQTLLTVGEAYGLTKERVRQIEKKALDSLRQKISDEDFGSYANS